MNYKVDKPEYAIKITDPFKLGVEYRTDCGYGRKNAIREIISEINDFHKNESIDKLCKIIERNISTISVPEQIVVKTLENSKNKIALTSFVKENFLCNFDFNYQNPKMIEYSFKANFERDRIKKFIEKVKMLTDSSIYERDLEEYMFAREFVSEANLHYMDHNIMSKTIDYIFDGEFKTNEHIEKCIKKLLKERVLKTQKFLSNL